MIVRSSVANFVAGRSDFCFANFATGSFGLLLIILFLVVWTSVANIVAGRLDFYC